MNLLRKKEEERRGPKTWPKGTNCDRLEGNHIGVIDSRHVDLEERKVDDWVRGVGVGKGLTAG